MGMLGALYMLGQGVQRDAMSAFKLFQRGAKLGDPASQTAMGLCLCSGRGADPDFSLAAFWLYRAARQKYAQAVGVLGWLVETKPEVVGEHFSMDDVCQVLEDWRRAKVAAQHQSLFESMTSPQGTMH